MLLKHLQRHEKIKNILEKNLTTWDTAIQDVVAIR